jgi:hypothetical protein
MGAIHDAVMARFRAAAAPSRRRKSLRSIFFVMNKPSVTAGLM